jgi:hypothetical protein
MRDAGIIFAAIATLACGRDSDRALAASPTHPGWIILRADDTLRVELDTNALTWNAGRASLWIGFADVKGEIAKSAEPPFLRFETYQDINCMMQIARGLRVRTPDTDGRLFISPVRDTSWFLFREHPLGAPLLLDICDVFGQP